MKKFYLHNGTEQMGPFDVEDLKQKNINKNTPIWHEGLSDWTTADKIEELTDLFKSTTPPPFSGVKNDHQTFNKPIMQNQKSNKIEKKKKSNVGLFALIIFVLLLLGGGAIMILNNPNAVPGVKFEINTPKPMVVTSHADGKKSGLFNARTSVYASILNQGGDGNVTVTFYVTQGSKTFDKSKTVFLSAGQSKDLEMTFEEVDYISGKITYDVEAVAH